MTSVQEKQQYLRRQILSKYNAEEFIAYVRNNFSNNTFDISKIDMKVLQQIVKQFCHFKIEQSQYEQIIPKKLKMIQYEKDMPSDYEFQKKCKCLDLDLPDKQIQIFIPSYQIKKTQGFLFSLGSKTEIWYEIKSNYCKQTIKRLDSDFQWISNTISRIFPLLGVPTLFPLTTETQQNHQKRRKQLEEYIQILASQSQLRSSHYFINFITLPQQNFQKYKQKTDQVRFKKGIKLIKNQYGFINIKLTNETRNVTLNTQFYTKKTQQIHEKISQRFDRTVDLFVEVSTEINQILKDFAHLHTLYDELTKKSPELFLNGYQDILININNLFHLISQNMTQNAKIIHEDLNQFFKLSINHDRSMTRLNRLVFSTEKQYVWAKNNLSRKKQRMYSDPTKWGVTQKLEQLQKLSKAEALQIMLPSESQEEYSERLWLAYLYNNYERQFKKYILLQFKRYRTQFCTFASDLLILNQSYNQELTKFIDQSRNLTV